MAAVFGQRCYLCINTPTDQNLQAKQRSTGFGRIKKCDYFLRKPDPIDLQRAEFKKQILIVHE